MNKDIETRKKVHESIQNRYGDDADTLIKFMRSISYSLYWGESIIIDESSNKWKPVHANRKADLHRWAESKGMSRKKSLAEGPVIYPTRLSLWRLERHLNHIITAHKGDLLYFSRGPNALINGLTYLSCKILICILLRLSNRTPWSLLNGLFQSSISLPI